MAFPVALTCASEFALAEQNSFFTKMNRVPRVELFLEFREFNYFSSAES